MSAPRPRGCRQTPMRPGRGGRLHARAGSDGKAGATGRRRARPRPRTTGDRRSLVRAAGLEPARPCGPGSLSPMRLPFRHARSRPQALSGRRTLSKTVDRSRGVPVDPDPVNQPNPEFAAGAENRLQHPRAAGPAAGACRDASPRHHGCQDPPASFDRKCPKARRAPQSGCARGVTSDRRAGSPVRRQGGDKPGAAMAAATGTSDRPAGCQARRQCGDSPARQYRRTVDVRPARRMPGAPPRPRNPGAAGPAHPATSGPPTRRATVTLATPALSL